MREYFVYIVIDSTKSEAYNIKRIRKMVEYCCRNNEEYLYKDLRWLKNPCTIVNESRYAFFKCDENFEALEPFLLTREFTELKQPCFLFDIKCRGISLGTIQ